MDPLHILQITLYSKIFNELATKIDMNINNLFIIGLLYLVFKLMNTEKIQEYISGLLLISKESSLTIPQHKQISYTYMYGLKETTKTVHSIKFDSLTHFLINFNSRQVSNVTEIIYNPSHPLERDNTKQQDEFIYLPTQNQKFLICKKNNIYIEIIITEPEKESKDNNSSRNNNNNNNSSSNNTNKSLNKNYAYKLSTPELNKLRILEQFIDSCIIEYEKEININKTPIFEYTKTEQDEDGRGKSVYKQFNFKSNKHLDKNIFFEDKSNFIKYIDQFSKYISDEDKQKYEAVYEDNGITYKAGILLYGEPGCGKSCTIRGILNRTGRIGVLIRWSLLKTCTDFREAFSTKINGTVYGLEDLCFIVEDFDANSDNVLKSRNIATTTAATTPSMQQHKASDPDFKVQMEEYIKTIKPVDELSLDFILNFQDGINERHKSMTCFTTNHIEKIDKAFLRAGRIDYTLNFVNASVKIIREMVEHKYRDTNIDFTQYNHYFENMKSGIISPAKVQQLYLKYDVDEIEQCLIALVDATNL